MSDGFNAFNNGGNPVSGMAKYHFTGKQGKSQTTHDRADRAVTAMNTGKMEHVGRTGTGDRDDKVMDAYGGVWGVHQQPGPGGGVRQAYPMHKAMPVPSKNRWGGNTGGVTFDPNQKSPSKHTVFEGPNGTPRNIDV